MNENKNVQELNDKELEQTAGGVSTDPGFFPNANGGTAISTTSNLYVNSPAIAPAPNFTIPAAPVLPAGGTNYTVLSGDTLSKIAKAYNTTVTNLMALNPQITDANKIYVGQILRVS